MAQEFTFQEITDPEKIKKLKARADEMFEEALDLMNSTDDWKLNKEDPGEAVLYSKRLKKGSKRVVFRIQGRITLGAEKFREKFFSPESWNTMASWNETIKEAKVLQVLEDGVFIMYQATQANGPGGMVSSRDFVYLRKEKEVDGVKFVCYESLDLDCSPPVKGIVRADCSPCCVRIEASPSGDPDECQFTWTVDMDFKLSWFPESLFNQIFQHILFSNFKAIRERAARIKSGSES